MGRGTKLSEYQRGQIKAYRDAGKSIRDIAIAIGKSKTVVANFLADPKNYGKKKPTGRPPKLSDRDKSAILRVATKDGSPAAHILRGLQLNVTPRTVQRVLKKSPNHQYRKMTKRPQKN